MKEYECVEVKNYKDVSKTIEEHQRNGWRLHTYTCGAKGMGAIINHYLLFEKGE